MKRLCVILAVALQISATDFKPLSDHAAILYNLVDEYVSTHSTQSAHNVFLYVNSEATKVVFGDARNSGYQKRDVVFEAYQLSFSSDTKKDVIIDGLHEVLASENTLREAVFYGTWTNVGVTSLMVLGLSRFMWMYFRNDRKVLNYYRKNAHSYLTGGTNNMNSNRPLDTNAPLIPVVTEPWFNQ